MSEVRYVWGVLFTGREWVFIFCLRGLLGFDD